MVTATGPGGVGKTRLALSVAAEIAPDRRDGAWFVDLVQVTDPAMVVAAIAETVGVPEQRSISVDVALVASLAERDALLVIDNCEHVLDGVRPCVERILGGCPEVTVLATSRTRLLVPYERVYAVPGLSVGDDGGDAVDLFAARVAAATGEPRRLTAAGRRAVPGAGRHGAGHRAGRGPVRDARARRSGGRPRRAAAVPHRRRPRSRPAWLAARRHRLELRPALADDRVLLAGVAVFASWFDVDAACAVAGPAANVPRSPTGWPGWPSTACSSSSAASRPGTGRWRRSASTASSGWTDAGELDAIRAGHERWCRLAVAALRRPTAEIDDAWCAQFDRVVDDIGAALAWSAADEQRAGAGGDAGRRARRAAVRPRPAGAGAATLRAGRRARRDA